MRAVRTEEEQQPVEGDAGGLADCLEHANVVAQADHDVEEKGILPVEFLSGVRRSDGFGTYLFLEQHAD